MKQFDEIMQEDIRLINEALARILTFRGETYDEVIEAMRY